MLFSWWMTQGEPFPDLWHSVCSSLCLQILASLNSQPYLFNSGNHQTFFGFPFLHCSLETLQTATKAVIKLTLFFFSEITVLSCLLSSVWSLFMHFYFPIFSCLKREEYKPGLCYFIMVKGGSLVCILCFSYMSFFFMVFFFLAYRIFFLFGYFLTPFKSLEFYLDEPHFWNFPWCPLIEIIISSSVFQVPIVSDTSVCST